jgi:hypothetical protein
LSHAPTHCEHAAFNPNRHVPCVSCQPQGSCGCPIESQTVYHSRDKVTVLPVRCQRHGDILTAPGEICTNFSIYPQHHPHQQTMIARGYDGILFLQILRRPRFSDELVACRKTQITGETHGPVQRALLPITFVSRSSLMSPQQGKSDCAVLPSLALMQPYSPYDWSGSHTSNMSCFPSCSERCFATLHRLADVY